MCRSVSGNQVPNMTEQWRRAIRHRNHLWKDFTRNRSDANYANYAAYKSQRNICTSLRREAIKDYFRKKSEEINQNPRQFWDTYRPFLHSKRSFKANDIILKEDEQIIAEKSAIASIFNYYFINIANHIDIPNCDVYGRDFVDHPRVKAIIENVRSAGTPDLSFSLTSPARVQQLLQDIKVNKSPGHDNITARMLKESAEVIAAPLASIFNSSILQCRYPSPWKNGQITPLLKSSEDGMNKKFF